jgi:SAM-dependent methyltransferase
VTTDQHLSDAGQQPYTSHVDVVAEVNWSPELEPLHEEASRTHVLDRWTRSAIIARVAHLPAAPTIIDIGCSTGYLLDDLSRRCPSARLIGVDLVASGLVKAHELVPRAELLHADACALPLADGVADAVVSANLLEHVPDDVMALREIARVLRPGASAVLVVPAGPSTYDYYDRFLGHERRYGRRELASKCRTAGLQVTDDLHIGSLLYPAFWTVKQRNRRRFGNLEGHALEAKVTSDIRRTHGSRTAELSRRIETRLVAAGVRLRFGIRSLAVARKPGVAS